MGFFDSLFGPPAKARWSHPRRLTPEQEAAWRKRALKENLREVASSTGVIAKVRANALKDGTVLPVGGKIYFPTASARALWKAEVLAQLSDGVWETLAPHKKFKNERDLAANRWHWVYWAELLPLVGRTAKVVCKQKPYTPLADYQFAREFGPRSYFMTAGELNQEAMLDIGRATSPLGADYGMKDLQEDLRSIRKAMESAWGKK